MIKVILDSKGGDMSRLIFNMLSYSALAVFFISVIVNHLGYSHIIRKSGATVTYIEALKNYKDKFSGDRKEMLIYAICIGSWVIFSVSLLVLFLLATTNRYLFFKGY